MLKLTAFLFFLLITSFAYSQTRIKICVVDQKQLKEVEANYNTSNGDTTLLINGARKFFRDVYPAFGKEYAASTTWYINNETLQIRGRKFEKYGLPRILGTSEITRAAEYKGVGVYVEAGTSGVPEVIYIPARSGCEFQPYQIVTASK